MGTVEKYTIFDVRFIYSTRYQWLIILVLLVTNVYAQEPDNSTFSRQVLLKDTGAIMQQLKKVGSIAERSNDSAVALTNQLLLSSRRLHFNRGIAASFFQLSTFYFIKGDMKHCVSALTSALQFCDTTKSGNTLRVRILTNIAQCYSMTGNMDSSAIYHYKALDAINEFKIDNTDVLARSYCDMIVFWVDLWGNSINEVIDDKYFETASAYMSKVSIQQNTSRKTRGIVLLAMGHIQKIRNHNDSARYFYRQYLELSEKGGMGRQTGAINSTLLNICETFIAENNGDSVYKYAQEAFNRATAKEKQTVSALHPILSGYYLSKALLMQKKYQASIRIGSAAIENSKKAGLPYMRIWAYQNLAVAYNETGNYSMAYKAQQHYAEMKDSLVKNEKILAISQMEMKYRIAEKNKELAEKELAIAKKDNSLQVKNFWIAGIAILLLTGIVIGLLLHRQYQQKARIRTLDARIEGEEKERSRLAAELHDGIGGVLGSIRFQLSAEVRKYEAVDRAVELKHLLNMLAEACIELRKTSHNLMPQTLKQQGLQNATALFCRNVSDAKTIVVDFEMVGVLPKLKPPVELMIYRIIQELVHNIIKHAHATHAIVQLAVVGNQIGVTVEDNGVGMNENEETAGMGLSTIRDRVKNIGGHLEISSSPGAGTSINLLLCVD